MLVQYLNEARQCGEMSVHAGLVKNDNKVAYEFLDDKHPVDRQSLIHSFSQSFTLSLMVSHSAMAAHRHSWHFALHL